MQQELKGRPPQEVKISKLWARHILVQIVIRAPDNWRRRGLSVNVLQ